MPTFDAAYVARMERMYASAPIAEHERRVIPPASALAELLGKRDNDALRPADVG
jgi:hypothetical protein